MKVLVCGGAGYIGSCLVRELVRGGVHSVVVADSLEATKGYSKHLPLDKIALETGDVRDEAFVDKVFSTHKPNAVVHMCGSIVVPESCKDPLKYYDNNVVGAMRVAQAMRKYDCKYFVFSSTAALFGTPKDTSAPIKPDDAIQPESPYGDSKFITEMMMKSCDAAYGMKYVCLRYFNACGAHPDGDLGETHDPETHLIPIVLQVPLGKRAHVMMNGTDYPTADGTCVRDYVHIVDLATAHIQALDYLAAGGKSGVFNLGTGHGYSVRQVVEVARKVTGHPIPAIEAERRPGDPPCLVASPDKAKEILKWTPKFDTLESIIETAWKFHSAYPNGYLPKQ